MEFTIEITQYCENGCDYCSTNASEDGEHLSFDSIRNFLERYKDEQILVKADRINISGGEPLAHPEFYKILKYCKQITDNVWVYTNALDKIIYNTDVVREISVEANVCLVPGRSVYLPENVDKTHLLQLVLQGRAKDMKQGKYHVSSNIAKQNNHKHDCFTCKHLVLQADGRIVDAPCRKDYKNG